MPSGLPSALSLRSISRNFSRAVHTIAATCLIGAVVVVLAFQTQSGSLVLWPAVVGLVPIGVGLFLLDRQQTSLFSIVYLAAGAISVYVYSLVFEAQVAPSVLASTLTVELPQIALIMIGSTGAGSVSALRWSSAGFAAGVIATSVARFQLGLPFRVGGVTVGAFAVVALVLVLAYLDRRRASVTRPKFVSAAQEELVALLRYRIETRAAAIMHDTVLSHLAAITATPSTRLPPALVEQMTDDLELLAAGDWLDDPVHAVAGDVDWRDTPFGVAVSGAEDLGLTVGVTGEVASVIRLDPGAGAALGLALKQCLVNVVTHSGVSDAELAVYAADDEVLVMVVDTGSGFDPDALASDRLGIRSSIVSRIEATGGSAKIWSTPGRGTSIVLRLPVSEARSRASVEPGGAS